MKIQSPTSTRSVGSSRKSSDKPKVNTGEFARALDEEGETEGTAAMSGASPVNAIDALLSIQEMSGDQEGNRRAKQRAEALLEKLDALRHGLLGGHLSPDQLDGLVSLVQAERAHAADPGLSETLDEIELLAKVELAKRGRDV